MLLILSEDSTTRLVELATLTSQSFSDVQAYANHHLELCRRIVDLGGLSLEDHNPLPT